MGQDERWPMLPFLIVRAIQTLFGIMLLGMTAYICSVGTVWWAVMGLFIALVILIWMVMNFVLFFNGILLPLAVVIVDAFCVVFLLISMAGSADSGWLATFDCSYYTSSSYSSYSSPYYYSSVSLCSTIKGAFAIELLGMLLFIGSLVFASMTLHKYRKDLCGRKHANGGVAPVSAPTELLPQSSQTQKPLEQYYPQPPQNMQQPPQHLQQPPMNLQQPMPPTSYQPVYNNQQPQYMEQQPYSPGPTNEGFSPPTSPPPMEMQHGYTVSNVPPYGWSTAAAEMPATSQPRGAELSN